ncbi:Translocating chain-associated membrane protein 1 [Chelonia mydas]|uniref:Translocating chain-associated membrane protein 1 n=1 Tax=Chelonia mydas TaxID=8469 RepID=M7BEX6_CHEMY|nr:Translocating chain-associated membrane protein 1 [Chelonia mydas]
MGLRRKNKSPPVLSHEFVIQNHADAVSCLAMGLLLGLMFEVTAKYVIIFITVQYNVTYTTDDRSEPIHFYEYGPKDIATIFFYMLIAIILHAVIQEYILDEDIPRQLYYICLYIAHICGAYVLKFTFWALLFVMARLLTLTLSVLTFGFGLARVENPGFSIADGNFNVLTVSTPPGPSIDRHWSPSMAPTKKPKKTVQGWSPTFRKGKASARVALPLHDEASKINNALWQSSSSLPHISKGAEHKYFMPSKGHEYLYTHPAPNSLVVEAVNHRKRQANFVNGAVKLEDGASPRTRKSKVL